eukprot:PLAT3185.1.p1 GENE.PLAT3185.1~~PLAT3185.1.p1  ORF type:complete len:239 (+),score=99.26 PLAT3185.1:35-718(+)
MAFRAGSRTLFSGSFDKMVKLWSLDTMSYVESVIGHEDQVNAIASLYKERAVTGGSDATMRVWKIVDESHLVLQSKGASLDAVAMANEQFYISGSQGGTLQMWNIQRQKAVFTQTRAHGSEDNWITALAARRHTDMLASGSCDGYLRLWGIDIEMPRLNRLPRVPMEGFINGIAFADSGRFLLAAVGKEHRLGSWDSRAVRDGLRLVRLPGDDAAGDDDGSDADIDD